MERLFLLLNDIIAIYKVAVVVFIGIIGILTIILVSFYRNKKGLFKDKKETDNNLIHIYKEEVIDNFTDKKQTKEELADDAYKDYNSGKITEAELNNRLRRIWWSEDD